MINKEELKQRLMRLVSDVQYLGGLEEKVAGHLIANGVTIRECGEWELHGNDDDLGSSFFCSVCGWNIDEDMFYRSQTNDYKMYKYCPNCGADMRGVKDE